MKAFLKNYRQSPRKVALVAGLIKGKRVSEAFILLDNMPKRASLSIKKLLASAVANAKGMGSINEENLFVENVTVDKGIVMKRIMPRARGSASRINKRTSHVLLTLVEKNAVKKVKEEKKEDVKEVKKTKEAISKKVVASKKEKTVKKTEVKK